MKNISPTISIKHFIRLLIRFNFTVSVVLVSGFLILSVITLNNILNQPNVGGTGPNTTSSIFDQPTVNRLQKLDTSPNNNNYQTLPSGRVNPFSD